MRIIVVEIAQKCPIEFIDVIHAIQNPATKRNIDAHKNGNNVIVGKFVST